MGPAARRMEALSARGAIFTVVVGAIVVIASMAADALPAPLRKPLSAIEASTGVGFILCGYSLWAQRAHLSSRHHQSARVCAGVVVAMAAFMVAYRAILSPSGNPPIPDVDDMDIASWALDQTAGPIAAVALGLMGLALLALDLRVGGWFPGQWFALAGTLMALLASLGYLYDAPALYAVAGPAALRPQAAFALFLLGCAILLARPVAGLMQPLSGATDSAYIARRMLPAVLLVPIALGWVRMLGQRRGLYETEFGLAIYALSNVACVGGLTWWTAARLARSEQQRKAAEADRAEREQDLAMTLSSIGEAVIATDSHGRVVRMNPVAEQLVGWKFDEAVGRPLSQVFHFVDVATRAVIDDTALGILREPGAAGPPKHGLLVSREGEERVIVNRGARILGRAGESRGAVLVFRDATEERAIERRAREAMARKAAVVDAALDCIVGMDHEGKIVEFNPAAERTFGRQRDDVIGRPLADIIIPPAYREAHRAGFRRSITNGEKRILGKRVELVAMRADGTEFPVELTVIRIPGEGPPSFEGFMRDLTEQKAAEAALRASEASKNAAQAQLVVSDRMASVGTLAAGVAHEINNPLAAVIANLEFMAEQLADVEAAGSAAGSTLRDALRDATEGAHRVRQIVIDLRVFARSEEDRVESVDIHATLDSTVRMAWNEIRHRARLTKAYQSSIPHVLGSAPRLGQVFLNLLVNAAQAIPEGRADANEIRVVTTTDSRGQVAVEIRDTGMGMTPEVLSRLFVPFFTTKPKGVGTGLGLAICKRIVTGMGGDISVTSQPSVGTTVRIVLPATDREVVGETKAPIASRASRRGVILVVDDDPMIGLAISRTLSNEHDLRVMTNATDALAVIAGGHRYDVILCDMMMPVVTGMEFYRLLRASEPEQADRVVFLTGGAFTIETREFLEQIPNARMEKPFQIQTLRALINERVR